MWYKWSGVEIMRAESLDLPDGVHLGPDDANLSGTESAQGWKWFASDEEAQVLDPTPKAIDLNLVEVTLSAEEAALEKFNSMVVGTVSMTKLRDAFRAASAERIRVLSEQGGLVVE